MLCLGGCHAEIFEDVAVFASAAHRSNCRRCLSHCCRSIGCRTAGSEGKRTQHDPDTDTGAPGDSAGDILTFGQNEVFDADDKNKVGFDQGICYRIVPGKAWECIWTLALDKGQLTVEGPFYDKGDSVLAITGGTGEYADARGEMALSDVSGGQGTKYTFTYKIK